MNGKFHLWWAFITAIYTSAGIQKHNSNQTNMDKWTDWYDPRGKIVLKRILCKCFQKFKYKQNQETENKKKNEWHEYVNVVLEKRVNLSDFQKWVFNVRGWAEKFIHRL